MTFSVRVPVDADAYAIAPMLTDIARSEVEAIGATDIGAAIAMLAARSAHSYCGADDKGPLFLGGAVPAPGTEDEAIVWMVMTTRVAQQRFNCLKAIRGEVEAMSKRWRVLRNNTDQRHPRTKAWLEWLGFTVGEPIPHPRTGEMIVPFERTTQHV